MVCAATPWVAVAVGIAAGSMAFGVLVLSSAAFALGAAKRKNKTAGGFFVVGLILLLVIAPFTSRVTSLFQPAIRGVAFVDVPLEIIFAVLAIGCIFRSWLLWTSDEKA